MGFGMFGPGCCCSVPPDLCLDPICGPCEWYFEMPPLYSSVSPGGWPIDLNRVDGPIILRRGPSPVFAGLPFPFDKAVAWFNAINFADIWDKYLVQPEPRGPVYAYDYTDVPSYRAALWWSFVSTRTLPTPPFYYNSDAAGYVLWIDSPNTSKCAYVLTLMKGTGYPNGVMAEWRTPLSNTPKSPDGACNCTLELTKTIDDHVYPYPSTVSMISYAPGTDLFAMRRDIPKIYFKVTGSSKIPDCCFAGDLVLGGSLGAFWRGGLVFTLPFTNPFSGEIIYSEVGIAASLSVPANGGAFCIGNPPGLSFGAQSAPIELGEPLFVRTDWGYLASINWGSDCSLPWSIFTGVGAAQGSVLGIHSALRTPWRLDYPPPEPEVPFGNLIQRTNYDYSYSGNTPFATATWKIGRTSIYLDPREDTITVEASTTPC